MSDCVYVVPRYR